MQGYPWLAVAVLGLLFFVFRLRLVESVLGSRHRAPTARLVRECQACRALVRSGCSHCTACGQALNEDLAWHCGHCLQRVSEAGTCPHCQATIG